MRNLLLIFLAVCMVGAVQGASIVYLSGSGVTDLSDGPAWDGGVAPGAFTNCTDMDNFKNWELFVDGQRARNLGILVSNGQLRLVSKGTILVVR